MEINIDRTKWWQRIYAALIFFTRLPLWRIYQPPQQCYQTVVEHWPLAGWLTGGVMAATVYFGSMLFPFHIALIIAIISRKKLINWVSRQLTTFVNWLVGAITFGKKRQVLNPEKVNKYFLDLHEDFLTAKKEKKLLVKPVIWGFIYNFLEIATYEIVAISLGHGEIFPQIMVAEALGSLVGAILPTPGGVGGYEGSMITVMCVLGTNLAVASTVVIVTRVIVLLNTIVSGYGFYQSAISKIGKADKKKVFEASEE